MNPCWIVAFEGLGWSPLMWSSWCCFKRLTTTWTTECSKHIVGLGKIIHSIKLNLPKDHKLAYIGAFQHLFKAIQNDCLFWTPVSCMSTAKFTYFLFSGSHLSFSLHLASRNARKFSCHSSWTTDGDWMPLSSLYRRNDFQSSDAFISSPLRYNLYLGPLWSGADLRFSRIHCCCSNWVGMWCHLYNIRKQSLINTTQVFKNI